MILKTLLLLISISSFLAAALIRYSGEGKALFFIKLFILSFISFISLTAFFIRSKRFQEILNIKPNNKFIIILFFVGFIFFLSISYILIGKYNDYIVCIDLDSISYFTQAKIFSTGHINVPSHKLREFFTTGYFINDGKFYSKYFPGWPLILSAGVSTGFPWVINPMLGLLTLIVVYFIGKEIYDRNTSFIASILLLFSSNFYYLNTSYLSEPSGLFFSCLFFYYTVKSLKEPKILTSSLAGFFLGIAFLIRPYSTVAISLPILLYFSYLSVIGRKKLLVSLLSVVISFLPALLILFIYNYYQTGSFILSPFEYYNPYDKIGFGLRSPDVFMRPESYTPFNALKNMLINMGILNWSGILFLFVFLLFLVINRKNKWDILLFATAISVIFFHFFYHAKSSRYYHVSFFALALLSARGISFSEISFKKIFPDKPLKNLRYFFLLFIIVTNIFITTSPQKILQRYVLYKQYRDPFNLVKERKLTNSVVFLKSVPEKFNNISYYVQNPLYYNGNVLFVKDLKEKNNELMGYYSEKEFYIYEFDRLKKSGKLTKLR